MVAGKIPALRRSGAPLVRAQSTSVTYCFLSNYHSIALIPGQATD